MPNNRLCVCGSGLAYQICCGAETNKEDDIQRHQLAAYVGEAGIRRAEFCRTYTLRKQSTLAEITTELRGVAQGAGEDISCHKGCTACCHVYVVASLQECEAIVYYLYQHETVLRHFLTAIKPWRVGINRIRDTFFAISRLQQKRLSHTDTPQDDKEFDAVLIKYAEQKLPCPLLKDDACSIYEVRPYVCAGLASTTPANWCTASHPKHKKAMLLKTNINMDDDQPYFASTDGQVLLTNMPALVYEILCYGWDFLRRVPGC